MWKLALFAAILLAHHATAQNKFMTAVQNATEAEKTNKTSIDNNPLKTAVQKYVKECGNGEDDSFMSSGRNWDNGGGRNWDNGAGRNWNNGGGRNWDNGGGKNWDKDQYDGRNYRKKSPHDEDCEEEGEGHNHQDRKPHKYAKRDAYDYMTKPSSRRDSSRDYNRGKNKNRNQGNCNNQDDDDDDDDNDDGYGNNGSRNRNNNNNNNKGGGWNSYGGSSSSNNNNRRGGGSNNRNNGYGNRNSGYGTDYGQKSYGNEYGQRGSYGSEDFFRYKRASDNQVQCLSQCVFGYLEVLNDSRMPSESAIIKFLQDHVPNEAKRIKALREARKCFGKLSTSDYQDGCEFSKSLSKCLKLEIE